jgi:hypothetical protein
VLDIKNIFGVSLQEYREWGWLDEFNYKVNYNANYILDITFNESGEAAYPDSHERTIPIDLKTGRILKAQDVFVEEKLAELAGYVDIKLKLEVAELMKSAKDHVDGKSIIDLLADLKFEGKNLDDFSVSNEGVTFLYDVGFPHAHIGFEPEGRYLFPYSTLKGFIKPTGPLGQFVK